MNRRTFLVSGALAAALATPAAAALSPLPSPSRMLAKSWRHVSTIDAITGGNVTEQYPHLASNIAYGSDGTYVAGDGVDTGVWTLSPDGRRLTLASGTFEYSMGLAVELLDGSRLRVSSRLIGADGVERSIIETFASSGRAIVTLR